MIFRGKHFYTEILFSLSRLKPIKKKILKLFYFKFPGILQKVGIHMPGGISLNSIYNNRILFPAYFKLRILYYAYSVGRYLASSQG